jgi:hypothetical protein
MLMYRNSPNDRWKAWHLGGGVPRFSRVVEFQADGDELNMIANVMAASTRGLDGVAYVKGSGGGKFTREP